jgi:hypothetical protein
VSKVLKETNKREEEEEVAKRHCTHFIHSSPEKNLK